jgi:ABC-type branched-subunit amino acid transport system substrate-binding protein
MSYAVEKVYESKSQPQTVVLWVSRHSPLPIQVAELEKKFGNIAVYQMSGMIPNAEVVVDTAKKYNASVIVPVLPLSMIARLAELARQNKFTVLLAKMNNVATTKSIEEAQRLVAERPEARTVATYVDGTVRVFEFERFEKLVEVRLVTEPL